MTENDSLLMNEATNKRVCELLLTVTGERGDNEGAFDVVARLIKESRMHDELVTALNEAINTICECCEHAAMTSEGDYICSKHIDGCGDTLKLRPTLTKAKGGQPDGSIDKANKDGE